MLNIICIKWGKYWYNENNVNFLYRSILKNTTLPIQFHCFTDDAQGLDANIISHPLPEFNTKINGWKYTKEAGLCDDNLGGLNGQRVFFFDLDVVITNNLDELFTYPKNDELYIIKDWYHKKGNIGQASCYSWVVGTLGWIKTDYENEPEKYFNKFGTAAQEFLSHKIIEKYGKLNFWPEEWFISFKYHCMPVWFLRHFKAPVFYGKDRCKVLCFHGTPKAEEALEGIYGEKNGKSVNIIKSLFYKFILPSKWLEKYLDD